MARAMFGTAAEGQNEPVSVIGRVFFGPAACHFFVLRAINRRQARKTYTYILQVLDRAIAGQLQPSAYDESMHAAVIERLNRVVQITHMHRKAAEKERDTLKSLISDISHQVRTPLANIMLYADLLKEANTDPQMDLFVEKLQKQSNKLYFL